MTFTSVLAGMLAAGRAIVDPVAATDRLTMAIPTDLLELNDCHDLPPTDDMVTIRVRIPDNLSKITNGVRMVQKGRLDPRDDDHVLDDGRLPVIRRDQANPEFIREPFHFSVSSLGLAKGTGFVRVLFVSQNQKLRFVDKGIAIPAKYSTGEVAADFSWFCKRPGSPISSSGDRDRSRVTAYIKVSSHPSKDTVSYSLILAASPDPKHGAGGGYQTPIIIDPKIRNEGEPN